jgi:thioredoxin-dependent peroxiredoxin
MLNPGDMAPDFNLQDQSGNMVRLSGFRGKTVVVYFYPKDDTPGCTAEACSFRDSLFEFTRNGIAVLGISADDNVSHGKFAQKYSLNFPILSDTAKKTCREWGVLQSLLGLEMVLRTTFIIDKDGRVKEVFKGVNPHGHAKEMLETAMR